MESNLHNLIILFNKARKTTLLTFTVLFFLSSQICLGQKQPPLPKGFAHNDYLHKRPLFDALENGYVNFEADIFLRNGELIVAHWFPYFKSKSKLESLYFKPLSTVLTADTSAQIEELTLLIDIKNSPEKTYAALKALLKKYENILTSFDEHGISRKGRLTIILTGKIPKQMIENESIRYVLLDDNLVENSETKNHSLYAMASCKYSDIITWRGKGDLNSKERERLISMIKTSHDRGRKVRLWASPENENVWRELLACGVDYIHTDELVKLKMFFANAEKSIPAN